MNPDVKAVHDAPEEGAAAADNDNGALSVWEVGKVGLHTTLPLGGALANVGICS